MSFNGSGLFVINSAGQPVVPATVISSTVFNALTADLATGLSTCITKDGQTTVTANIPFAGFKLTGVGAPTVSGDALVFGQAATTGNLTVVGTTGTNIASFSRATDSLQSIIVTNSNAGTAAQSAVYISNGTVSSGIVQYGAGVGTTAPFAVANGTAFFSGTGSGGLAIGTVSNTPITFVSNNAAIGTWSSTSLAPVALLDISAATAGQIKFPATANPSADANTLDDYEEGTWTPTLIGSGTAGTQTYTAQVGRYTKIGRLVFIQGRVAISAKDGAMAGNALIGGLPFAAASVSGNVTNAAAFSAYSSINLSAGYTELGGAPDSASTIQLFENGDNVAFQSVAVAAIGATTDIIFSASYSV